MMRAGDKFSIVCMKCNKDFNKVDNGKMILTLDNDLIIECSACGQIERYSFKNVK